MSLSSHLQLASPFIEPALSTACNARENPTLPTAQDASHFADLTQPPTRGLNSRHFPTLQPFYRHFQEIIKGTHFLLSCGRLLLYLRQLTIKSLFLLFRQIHLSLVRQCSRAYIADINNTDISFILASITFPTLLIDASFAQRLSISYCASTKSSRSRAASITKPGMVSN